MTTTNSSTKRPFWKRALQFFLGLLTGVGLTFVIQRGIVNVNGDHNTVNYYTISENKKDTTLIWQSTTIKSKDEKGRKIEFIVSVLSQEKRWELKSSTYLENKELFNKFFPNYLRTLKTLDSCSELIAVGVASEEGDFENELSRASKRADKIIEVLRPRVNGKPIYKLNLGKYKGKIASLETSDHRRVIIAGIKSRDSGMGTEDIRYSLFSGLKNKMKEKLDLELTDYSAFVLTNPN